VCLWISFHRRRLIAEPCFSAQSRAPIQILDEARDAVQTIHVSPTTIITGSVDGHVRTYDLRKGELRSDFIGRMFHPPTLFQITPSHFQRSYRQCSPNYRHPNSSNNNPRLYDPSSRHDDGEIAQFIQGPCEHRVSM
jgi:hypothetical protein